MQAIQSSMMISITYSHSELPKNDSQPYSLKYVGENNYHFVIVENGEEPEDYYYEKANVLVGVKGNKIVLLEIELLNPNEKLIKRLKA